MTVHNARLAKQIKQLDDDLNDTFPDTSFSKGDITIDGSDVTQFGADVTKDGAIEQTIQKIIATSSSVEMRLFNTNSDHFTVISFSPVH